jgi:hypothetical protein
LPGAVSVTEASLFLNVVLRNKHLVYAVSIGMALGLFYLYNVGYNHWLYNPMMYGLWTYANLTNVATLPPIISKRLVIVAISVVCLLLSHLLYQLTRPTILKRAP